LCSLITRAPAGASNKFNIVNVDDPYLNINQQHNRALDFTLRFRQGLGRFGSLSLLGQLTYQLKDSFTLFQGITTSNNGHAGDPKWVSQFNLSWNKAPFTVTYGLNVIAATSDLTGDNGAGLLALGPDAANCLPTDAAFALRGGPYCPVYHLPRVAYHSISVEVQATKDVSFLFGIANLFDKEPPLVSTVGTPISAFAQVPLLGSYYDYLGRRFFVSIKAAMPIAHHAAPAPVVAIPAPPPPAQTCPDGSVVAAGAACPVPPPAAPPPPPPPPTKGERG
jgi:iron complex outermembrane receptor protein